MPPRITFRKIPRSDPIPDIPINFQPLENLHLELLEIKGKLKPGVPAVPVVKRPPPQPKKNKPVKKTLPTKSKPDEEVVDDEEVDDDEVVDEVDDEILDELGVDQELEIEIDGDNTEVAEEEEDAEISEEEEDIYAGLSPEEREKKEKEEYIWRFRILKKQHSSPGANKSEIEIPEYNEHSDLDLMKKSYDRTVKELFLDDAVESYRTYLAAGFMVMEFGCANFLNIDMEGFALQQASMMYKYDRHLIELGEKSYNSWSSNLPVEVKLLGLVLFQAGIFYMGKNISQKYGGNVADLFRGITGQPPPQEPSSEKKKRMRGPKIKPDDIRHMARGETE